MIASIPTHWRVNIATIWLVFVIILSLLPLPSTANISTFAHSDKVVHFIFYGVSAILWWWAKTIHWRGVLLLCLMGWGIEFVQQLSGVRHGDIYDGLANMSGAISAWLLARTKMYNLK